MKKAVLFICCAGLLVLSGCVTVVGDTVMGYEQGKFVYNDGSLQANYRYPLDQVWEAAKKAMTDLKAQDMQLDRRIEKGIIECSLYEEKVKITMDYLTRTETSVSVRVGTAGSNVAAKLIHDKIDENLKKQ